MRARRTKAKTNDSPTASTARKSRARTAIRTTSVERARAALRAAIDRACIARGEAQWTNGYRAAQFGKKLTPEEDTRLFDKEMAQFKTCELAEARAESAMRAYARAIRERE